ncbi:MAG: ankyrin repeat domain-containing protein [Gammaproteobacteria bacterium]|nr:ankyrin repeat domain-containing protein [Gammaproteobacteria bacterium]
MSLEQAISDRDWDRVRDLVLDKHAEKRRFVGLGAESDLSAMQLVAQYESESVENLFKAGLYCDLHSACALGMIDRIREQSQIDQFEVVAEHLTPMGWAILNGQRASVKALLDCGDNPNRPLKRAGFFVWEMEALNHIRWSPLHLASLHGYNESAPDIVKCLVKAGADIESSSPLGCSPLGLASIYSWVAVMETLLDLGANIDAQSQPESDLVWKLSAPSQASIRTHGLTPLMIAVGEGQQKAAELLIERGCLLENRDSSGSSALHIAASPWWKESPEIVELLLSSGANPDVLNGEKMSPLEIARTRGYDCTANLLM